jgi:hypothetical protein
MMIKGLKPTEEEAFASIFKPLVETNGKRQASRPLASLASLKDVYRE